MRIGLDGTPVWGPPVGQYTYMANLIRSMLLLDTNHEFVVYCRKRIPEEFDSLSENVQFRICGFKNRKLCEQLAIPLHSYRDNLDVLHTCLWAAPYLIIT